MIVPAVRVRRAKPRSRHLALRASAVPATTSPELLLDAKVALPRLLDAIRGARRVINISMYGWLPSGSGAALAHAVEQKAREGVEVNILLDGRGSMQVPGLPGWKMAREMRAAGIHIVVNKSLVPVLDGPVDHCKAYSIDGNIGFLGGMNLSRTYDKWHDAMATLDAAGAQAVGRDFLAKWVARGGAVSAINRELYVNAPDQSSSTGSSVLANHPGSRPITQAFLDAVAGATTRVWVETPFLGSQAMVDALTAAARRGIDVRLVTDGLHTNDAVPGINLIGASYYAELKRAGVRIYTQQQMTHSKVMLLDNTVIMGSFNLTVRSKDRHWEIDLRNSSPAFVGQIDAMFGADMASGHEVTDEDMNKPVQRFLTWIRRFGIQY